MQQIDTPIAVIGLGYVGLPLAVEFGKKRKVFGYDINQSRIEELKKGIDKTLETTKKELSSAHHLSYTNNINDIEDCKIFIITVPTPIDIEKKPDLAPLKSASETIGAILKRAILLSMSQLFILELPKRYVFQFSKNNLDYLLIKNFIVAILLKE